MDILGLILLPFLFCFNSYFIGKLFTIKYKTLFSCYSFIAGLFAFVSIICFISIPFYLVIDIYSLYTYFLFAFQIFLIILYCLNWKRSLFCLLINGNRIIYFFTFLLFSSSIYLLFFFSYEKNFFVEQNFINNMNNPSMLTFFLSSYFNFFKVNVNLFYRICLPILIIIFLSSLSLGFIKIRNKFNWKKYVISICLITVLSTIIFLDFKNIFNYNGLLFLALFFITNFIITKYRKINFKNNYLIYNLSLFYMVILNSEFIIYAILSHLLFIISSYSMRNEFSLDKIIKSSIYFLLLIIISILNSQLFILGIVFAIFIILIIIFFILSKDDKYYQTIFKIEYFLNGKIKYILLIFSSIIIGTILVLIIGNNYEFNINLFKFNNLLLTNILYKQIIEISFYVFYGIINLYGILNFIFKFKKHEESFGKNLILSISVLTIFNPLMISLLNYLPSFFSFDNKIIFLILFLMVFMIFFRNGVDYSESIKEKFKNENINKKELFFASFRKIAINFNYYFYCFISIVFVIGIATFSYIL